MIIGSIVACSLAISSCFGQSNYTLSMELDSSKEMSTLILVDQNNTLDKVTFSDMDLLVNSLTRLDTNLWKYKYSFGSSESHGMFSVREVLVSISEERLHISYLGLARYFNKPNKEGNGGYHWHEEYELTLSDTGDQVFLTDSAVTHQIDGHGRVLSDSYEVTVKEEHKTLLRSGAFATRPQTIPAINLNHNSAMATRCNRAVAARRYPSASARLAFRVTRAVDAVRNLTPKSKG